MLRRLSTAVALLAVSTSAARAQGGAVSPQCQANTILAAAAQDACQKSVDLFNYLAPQLGALIAGGNVEPGQGGTLGGLGHFGVSVRANVLRSPFPQFDQVEVQPFPARASNIPVNNTTVAFPVADVAVGLFRGVPLGVATVAGLDALVNATYLPDVTQDQVRVQSAGGSLRLGYGLRLGLLGENALLPGVAVSVLRRETPRADIAAATGDDSLSVTGTRVRTDSWRLTAAKRLVIVSLAAGVGQDRYRSEARVRGVVNDPRLILIGAPTRAESSVDLAQTLTRTNVFANLTLLAIPFARIVGEVGRTSGGTLAATYNSIDGRRPDAAYTYGSVGVRLGR